MMGSHSRVVSTYLTLYRMLGFCPASVNGVNNEFSLTYLIFLTLLNGIVTFLIIFKFYDHQYIAAFVKNISGTVNNFTLFYFNAITCFSTLVESFFQRREYSKFWATLRSHYSHCSYKKYPVVLSNMSRTFIFKSTLFIIAATVSYLASFAANLGAQGATLFWICHTPLGLLISLRHLQFIHYVEIIRFHVQQLADDLKHTVQFSEHWSSRARSSEQVNVFVASCLQRAKDTHIAICKLTQYVNNGFGISILCCILSDFVTMLSDSYFLYWRIYSNYNGVHALQHIQQKLTVVPAAMSFVMVLCSTRDCKDSMKEVTFFLHKINRDVLNKNVSKMIDIFSLQIVHGNIQFHTHGILVLDCELLRGMLTSITTYLVFFIQFNYLL